MSSKLTVRFASLLGAEALSIIYCIALSDSGKALLVTQALRDLLVNERIVSTQMAHAIPHS